MLKNITEMNQLIPLSTNQHIWEFVDWGINGVFKYKCEQYDYQASTQRHLKTNNCSIHKGVKYKCDQFCYQATTESDLRRQN